MRYVDCNRQYRPQKSKMQISWSSGMALLILVGASAGAVAQTQNSRGNCNPNIISGGNVNVNCPPPVMHNGTCPPNMIYSRTHGDCIPIQNRGGVIPCSPDDMSFIPGRGWISNCR